LIVKIIRSDTLIIFRVSFFDFCNIKTAVCSGSYARIFIFEMRLVRFFENFYFLIFTTQKTFYAAGALDKKFI